MVPIIITCLGLTIIAFLFDFEVTGTDELLTSIIDLQ